jgi:preprotein translocase subunit SecA
MNKHREIVYRRRRDFLLNEDLEPIIKHLLDQEATLLAQAYTSGEVAQWQIDTLSTQLESITGGTVSTIVEKIRALKKHDEVIAILHEFFLERYEAQKNVLADPKMFFHILRQVCLRAIDSLWMDHIDEMTKLREAVSLRGYAQRDPLIEYKSEAYSSFQQLLRKIESNTVITLFRMDLSLIAAQQIHASTDDMHLKTNENEVADIEEGDREFLPTTKPKVIRLESGSHTQTVSTGDASSDAIGRNDPCPCGSGKKYKKCCGA